MYLDAHVHSLLSPDSEMNPEDAIRKLKRQGLGVCFTEHVDYVTPTEGRDPSATDAPRAPFDFLLSEPQAYPACYEAFRGDGVFFGLEIGLNAAFLPLNRETAARDGLDYVIGSIHFADGYDLTNEYFEAVSDPYRRMLTYTREMVERCDFFDTLGHIDYIARYSPLEEKDVRYAAYPDEYDALFTAMIERDIALEMNTARFGEARAEANLYQIYRRYRALGGRFVTIGSDAHRPERVGRYHARALKMARETGLAPVYYIARKRYPCV